MALSRRDLLTFWRPSKPPPSPDPDVEAPAPLPAAEVPVVSPAYLPSPPTPSARPAPAARELVRPPGAVVDGSFATRCTRCNDCIDACVPKVIARVADGPDAGTPYIDTRHTPCVLCATLPCAHACTTGALVAPASVTDVRMGVALVDVGACLAYRGAPCRACVDVCPVAGVLTFAKGARVYVPVAGEAPCVGCGLCQRYCPARAIDIEGTSGRVRLLGDAASR